MENTKPDIIWEQWPDDVPRPTPEQWEAAETRLRREQDDLQERLRSEGKPPYMGDCGYSLAFDMATCSIETWWHLFFPDSERFKGWPVSAESK